ncbi:MAG TPA: metallopeptidase TldD-related protein [Mycobacteriales bacterium]|nr:metallopeptidase TldD-related protein [Mycobacteriales bacterium]
MTAPGGLTPQETVERALAMSKADGCVVIATEQFQTNLRWALNTLTTNGEMRSRQLSVISFVNGAAGMAAGVVERSAVTADTLEELVRASEQTARDAGPADDVAPLVEPHDAADDWAAPPVPTSVGVFSAFAPALGQAFGRAAADNRVLFGFAEHTVANHYLGSSTGLRRRHVQPTGKVEINGKSPDFVRSAWAGRATRDFTDIDVTALDAELAQRLAWAERSVDLPAGRYETLLPPSAVADLMYYLYSSAGARDADEGRTVFSKAGGGTRIGERLSEIPITLRSGPTEPGLEAAPFMVTTASYGGIASVFDNGQPIGPSDWIRSGELVDLIRTRAWAERTGATPRPWGDNLVLDAPPGGRPLAEMIGSTERGLLATSLWYIREVDPQTLLLTGLTRDGVYLVEGGEVTGAVNNFRWNESPVDLLGRLTEVGSTERCLPREWNDFFTRTAMPPLRVPDFNMSTVSKAS